VHLQVRDRYVVVLTALLQVHPSSAHVWLARSPETHVEVTGLTLLHALHAVRDGARKRILAALTADPRTDLRDIPLRADIPPVHPDVARLTREHMRVGTPVKRIANDMFDARPGSLVIEWVDAFRMGHDSQPVYTGLDLAAVSRAFAVYAPIVNA